MLTRAHLADMHADRHTCSCMYMYTPATHAYNQTYVQTKTSYTGKHTVIRIYSHTCTHVYIHPYIHTNKHINIQTYIHTYIHTYMHTYIHSYIHIHVHTYLRACVHKCIYIHTHACTFVLSKKVRVASQRRESATNKSKESK